MLLALIELFCIPTPDCSSLLYTLSKTEEYFHNHENDSIYFIDPGYFVNNIKAFLNADINKNKYCE